jgi:YD repeat-containing protein
LPLNPEPTSTEANPNSGFYYGGFTQTYDGAGNLASVTGDTAGTNRATNILSNTVYFPNGQRYTALELGIYNDKYSVTNRGWYTGELVTDPSSKTVWQTTAHRINTGTIDHTTDTAAGNWSYTYDPLNRLLTSTGPKGSTSYTTDAFGNKYLQTVTAGVGQPQTGPPPTPQNTLPGNGLTYEITYTSGGTQIN